MFPLKIGIIQRAVVADVYFLVVESKVGNKSHYLLLLTNTALQLYTPVSAL